MPDAMTWSPRVPQPRSDTDVAAARNATVRGWILLRLMVTIGREPATERSRDARGIPWDHGRKKRPHGLVHDLICVDLIRAHPKSPQGFEELGPGEPGA